MNVETILRNTIAMLNTCHVVGSEAETFAGALKNLKNVVSAIEKAREETEHEHNA